MNNDQIRGLYEQYSSWVFNRAKGFLKNEEAAWEAVQDIFLKVIQYGDHFRGDSSPWTWLYRITTNHCLNLIRSRKNWQRTFENLKTETWHLSLDREENPQSLLINRNSFVKLLSDEGETTQKIIYYYFVEDLTQEEIEEIMNISRKTIYKKLKKFMEKARGHL